MPFYPEAEGEPTPRAGIAPRDADPFDVGEPQTVAGTAIAAVRQTNSVLSLFQAIGDHAGPYDPDHNPLDLIRGTKYEADHLSDFIGSPNEASTRALMARIDRDEADRRMLAKSGVFGVAAMVGAGLTDPVNWLPLGDLAAAARTGAGIAGAVGRAGMMGAAAGATSEGGLLVSQPGRTWGEALGGVATSTILMGILGGAHAMLSPAELQALTADVDAARRTLPVTQQGESSAAVSPIGYGAAASASAAASDARTLTQKPFAPIPQAWREASPLLDRAGKAFEAVNDHLSPIGRIFGGENVAARRALADLAETVRTFEDNARGVTTTSDGLPPVSRLAKMQVDGQTRATQEIVDGAFVAYRYGENVPVLAQQRAAIGDALGRPNDGKMTLSEFKSAVYDALVNGDEHEVPAVARAARDIRSKVLDPVKEAAQATIGPDGRPLLAEELGPPAGDRSFAPRTWNRETLAARRNEFVGITTDWLASEQSKKAAAQARIGEIDRRRRDIRGQIEKLDRRIATSERRKAETEAQLKERVVELNAADARAARVEAAHDEIRQSISELSEFVAAMRAEARDPTTIDRINELARELEALRSMRAETGHTLGELGAFDNATPIGRALSDRTAAERAAVDAGIREREAGVPVTRSEDRFEDLQIRSTHHDVARELLQAAKSTAEEELARLTAQIEDEIRRWRGKSTGDAASALKRRDEAERLRQLKVEAGLFGARVDKKTGEWGEGTAGEPGRLASADGAVDLAVRRILESDRGLSRAELADRAQQIADRILSSPDGRLPYDDASVMGNAPMPGGQQLRGSLNAREFAIPTALVRDFVHTDVERAVQSLLRSVVPDILLTQRFGDIGMTEAFRKINEEFASQAAILTKEKDLLALEKRRQATIRDLAAIRDRIRGVYGLTADPTLRSAARLAENAKRWNVMADLGTVVPNSLNDAAGAVFRHGLVNVFRDGWVPYFKSLLGASSFRGEARRQAVAMNTAIEGLLGSRAHQLGDVFEAYAGGTRFERGLAWASDKSMTLNLLNPWTDLQKTVASTVAGAEVLRTAEKVAAGIATAKEIERLAAANISPATAERIWKAHVASGAEKVDGVLIPNTGDWADRGARQSFEAAIGRETDISVITPGQEKPLWLSSPVLSLLGQFRSFTASAHERLLIANLQQRDVRTLQGMVTSLGLGMLSYRLYTALSGQPASDRPQDWVKEGIRRAGILGWLDEANAMQAKFTAGKTDIYRLIGADKPLTRYAQRSALAEALGPTYSRLEKLTGSLGDAASGTWTAKDTHALRQVLPLQNLWAIRRLLDAAEDGVNSVAGIPARERAGAWR